MTDAQIKNWIQHHRQDYEVGRLQNWKAERLARIPEWRWRVRPYRNTLQDWVLIATTLASDNGGLLPSVSWLCNNKYQGLDKVMKNHPEAFHHILQERPQGHFRTAKDWLTVAETLARSNGGQLPSVRALSRSGYGALVQAMQKHPEVFRHFTQDRHCGRTIAEWVKIARTLAKQHKGVLPSPRWLTANGYNPLRQAMLREPSQFQNIAQERKYKNTTEWVQFASNLAGENGGFLPSMSRLKNKGLHSLVTIIYSHPEAFTHIPRAIGVAGGGITGFRNGTVAQRRALEIKHGLRPAERKRAA